VPYELPEVWFLEAELEVPDISFLGLADCVVFTPVLLAFAAVAVGVE